MPEIAVLAGDYIGPEIMAAGLTILAAAEKITQTHYTIHAYPFGGAAIDITGEPLPATTLEGVQKADAVLLAAIGGPKWDQAPERPEAGLLKLRKALHLFANIRPTKIRSTQVKASPLKAEIAQNTDFVIVRELTSGIYFGDRYLNADAAADTMFYTKAQIQRLLVVAFDLAMTRRKKVTVVDKANVLASSKLWRQMAQLVAMDYPEVTLNFEYVDATAMKIVTAPNEFDVLATSNLFGDILSDEAAAITGSIGTIASESKGSDGPSLYEPIHGSAPDIAGQGIANPISMIHSIQMMLTQTFQDEKTSAVIQRALDHTLAQNTVTPDLGGTTTTTEMTQAIIQSIQSEASAHVKTTNHVR